MNAKKIIAVLLCWNGIEDTRECLESLRHVDYPDFRTLLVDNGSTDGTAKIVREEFPEVEVVETGENLGFAGGNNVGICCALDAGAEAILLLNNDTIVDPKFLGPMVDALFGSHAVGAVNPLIYYHGRPEVIWAAGGGVDWDTGIAHQLHYEEVDVGQASEPTEVDYGVGTALLMRREAIEATGLLDPNFYLYYEETDWCCRARDVGYSTMLVPSSRIWHKVSRSIRDGSSQQVYYFSRNRLIFLSKRGIRPVKLAKTVAGFARMAAAMAVRGEAKQGLAAIRGVCDFCCHHYGKA